LTFPENFRFARFPPSAGTMTSFHPKPAGLDARRRTTVASAIPNHSAASASIKAFDSNRRKSPGSTNLSQLIPESDRGRQRGCTFETWGLSFEQQFGPGTFSRDRSCSKVDRELGAYNVDSFTITPISTREKLDYRERSLSITLNQLLGDECPLAPATDEPGAARGQFPDIPDSAATLALSGAPVKWKPFCTS